MSTQCRSVATNGIKIAVLVMASLASYSCSARYGLPEGINIGVSPVLARNWRGRPSRSWWKGEPDPRILLLGLTCLSVLGGFQGAFRSFIGLDAWARGLVSLGQAGNTA
jgi:hypothetical protein